MVERTSIRSVTVTNPNGLHARPADLLVRTAKRYAADIQIEKNGEYVDGKSILSVLTLAAVHGTRLSLIATGDDAEEALDALVDLFERGFLETGSSATPANDKP